MLDLNSPLIAPALTGVALLVALIALGWAVSLQRRLVAVERLRRQLAASEGTDFETAVRSTLDGVEDVRGRIGQVEVDTRARIANLEGVTRDLAQRQELALQHVGVVRFNPYQDTGGDQSFALALLDAHGDGVAISGLYARGVVRLFTKPVTKGGSTYPLTDEEKQAIQQALSRGQA